MTLPHLICQYCSHHNSGAEGRCAHCGAPLSAAAKPAHHTLQGDANRVLTGAEHAVGEVAKSVEGAGKEVSKDVAKVVTERLSNMSWRTALAILVAMVILALLAIRSCGGSSPDLPSIGELGAGGGGSSSSAGSLPGPLRAASSCRSADPSHATEDCTIEAGTPLLAGITSGRALSFSVHTEQPDRLASTISRWRSAGASVVTSGDIFAAIGSSANVYYADTRTGTRIETGAFSSQAGARTFLQRSGLAG
ncbi:hypothetical protein BJY24_007652 [Nocardia transvalensis]|uniref:Uncharacterized protein n=1 Tax=Nocardia transvalensis TaxID=37333 RepID=A0A7W9PM76_9NOCA|nr:hypothetical protein [Nocardia transvalensis]MBB5918740.1 hypothetical protein [Nocardia transvalensis]